MKINQAIGRFARDDVSRFRGFTWSNYQINVAGWPESELRVKTSHGPSLDQDWFDVGCAHKVKHLPYASFLHPAVQHQEAKCLVE